MNKCGGKGTIGEYTVTEETTMKQIDTAQLDITACQAQAAEYHARGFNCAQAVACTLAPSVGLDPQTAFILTEGFGLSLGLLGAFYLFAYAASAAAEHLVEKIHLPADEVQSSKQYDKVNYLP